MIIVDLYFTDAFMHAHRMRNEYCIGCVRRIRIGARRHRILLAIVIIYQVHNNIFRVARRKNNFSCFVIMYATKHKISHIADVHKTRLYPAEINALRIL